MSTIHNPVNFDPSQYRYIDSFDNCPPEAYPGSPWMTQEQIRARFEERQKELAWFRSERKRLFPDGNDHRCQHCGQSNVRYVVAAEHVPTGKHVCFGDICCANLEIAGFDAFQAKRLRERAAAKLESQKHARQALAFLDAHPEVKSAIQAIVGLGEAAPAFAQDLVSKFRQYATMSEKQMAWLIKLADPNYVDPKKAAIERRQAENAKSNFIGTVGERIQFTATVVKVMEFEGQSYNYYDSGTRTMTILKQGDDVIIYWNYLANEGETVTFKATIKKHNERDGVKQTIVSRAFRKE